MATPTASAGVPWSGTPCGPDLHHPARYVGYAAAAWSIMARRQDGPGGCSRVMLVPCRAGRRR